MYMYFIQRTNEVVDMQSAHFQFNFKNTISSSQKDGQNW